MLSVATACIPSDISEEMRAEPRFQGGLQYGWGCCRGNPLGAHARDREDVNADGDPRKGECDQIHLDLQL